MKNQSQLVVNLVSLLENREDQLEESPSFSVTALGKNRKKICSNNSLNNYGYNSPYHRLLKLNAKIINFGIPPVFNPIHIIRISNWVTYLL